MKKKYSAILLMITGLSITAQPAPDYVELDG
jgi:hypothetical protein